MAKPLPKIKVAPGILRWARESAGWSLDEVVGKLEIDEDELQGWEAGSVEVPLTRLEDLASLYKRPLAVFFLPGPPATPPPPTDFRSLPGGSSPFSKATWLALRRARHLQGVAGLLMAEIGDQTTAEPGSTSIQEDAETAAARERERLAISLEQQRGWKSEHDALRAWRDSIEQLSVLTFQFAMPVENARGFSLVDGGPPAMVVSSEDSPHARIFSLLHEYGHILLGTPGVCLPREDVASAPSVQVERWCDHFAGAVLIPHEALAHDEECIAFIEGRGNSSWHLSRMSHTYKVSRHAVLTRLLVLGSIPRRRYREERSSFPTSGATVKRKGGRGPAPAMRSLSERGRAFTNLFVRALERGVLNYSDVTEFLGIRLKHFAELRDLLGA